MNNDVHIHHAVNGVLQAARNAGRIFKKPSIKCDLRSDMAIVKLSFPGLGEFVGMHPAPSPLSQRELQKYLDRAAQVAARLALNAEDTR